MQEFYKFATTRLSPGGVLVTQSGAAAVHLKDECFTVIHKTLKSVFEHVSMSVADVPSFGCCWGFNLASDSEFFSKEVRNMGQERCWIWWRLLFTASGAFCFLRACVAVGFDVNR